ncbi:hypothetical protein DYBT9275_01371 [Dyadobacter sp. CECT 9275]|uniref:FecR family protein n=1 Tax=Dyadobacter helix TaxID=2822344 RepID=A0A916JA41_9BACT|nr:FecR family protein [Dyadobacter sp. CECT 9275]CAG4994340.1 hypothetical protein DYBT9275_01371 [Dyadobacter sp. CECT 9275]
MPDYRNYSPEELAADSSFRGWVLYNNPEDTLFWTEWLELNPDKTDLIVRTRKFLDSTLSYFEQITDEEVSSEIYRLSLTIGENEGKRPSRFWLFRPRWYSIAASILLALSVGWWFNRQSFNRKSTSTYKEILSKIQEPLQENINDTSLPKLVILEDGSSILLQPNSRITYPTRFAGSKREVFLSGEAFFEVAKKPDQPFFVYANTLATKVLGTSFKISAFDNETDVKVVVKTGKVSVFPLTHEALATQQSDNKLNGMVLTPNQQIVFAPKEQRLTRSLIADPAVLELPIQSQSFIFKASPISTVFATLEKSYGIQIIYDNETMNNCFLTATLSDEPLFEKIDLICKTIGAQYEQMDASIIITSKGCM